MGAGHGKEPKPLGKEIKGSVSSAFFGDFRVCFSGLSGYELDFFFVTFVLPGPDRQGGLCGNE
jgi:hypothetical protein